MVAVGFGCQVGLNTLLGPNLFVVIIHKSPRRSPLALMPRFFCNSVSLFFLLAHSIKQTNTGEAHFRPPLYHKNRILNSENMCVLGDISPELSEALSYSRLSKLFVREIRLLIILKDNVKINICSKKDLNVCCCKLRLDQHGCQGRWI